MNNEILDNMINAGILRNLTDDKSKLNEQTKAVLKESTSFYHNADEFMKSKRFERFVSIVMQKIDKFMTNLKIISVSPDGYKNQNSNPAFYECLKSASLEYLIKKIKAVREEDTIPDFRNNAFQISISFSSLIGSIPTKASSPLYDLEKILNNKISKKELFGDKNYEMVVGDITAESPVIRPILLTLSSVDFPSMCDFSLSKACYNYIHLQALEQDLTGENWFRAVKDITNYQIIWIMSKTYEYLLEDIEVRSAILAMYSLPKNSLKIFQELQLVGAELEKSKNETNELTEVVSKRDRELQKIRFENRELQNKINCSTSNNGELVKLRKQLKAKEEEIKILKEKYASATQYVDELQESLNKTESEPAVDTVADIDLTPLVDKRIVFIRDKKREDYVIMKRLAEVLPNARFTNCIASDIDGRATDLIVILASCVCHSTFWNAAGIAKRKRIPLISTSKLNFSQILNEIAKAI